MADLPAFLTIGQKLTLSVVAVLTSKMKALHAIKGTVPCVTMCGCWEGALNLGRVEPEDGDGLPVSFLKYLTRGDTNLMRYKPNLLVAMFLKFTFATLLKIDAFLSCAIYKLSRVHTSS